MPFIVPVDVGGQVDPYSAALAAALDTPADLADEVLDLATNAVDPRYSWLHWKCDLVLTEDDHLAITIPLAGTVQTGLGNGDDALGDVGALASNTLPGVPTVQGNVPVIIQRVTGPTFRAWLIGEAIRVQYPIAPPCLLSLGGQEVVQKNRSLRPTNAGNWGGYMVEYLGWEIEYALTGAPATLSVPACVTNFTDGRLAG